jgi:alpha-beta hydrolase superfamily lysophospholipase
MSLTLLQRPEHPASTYEEACARFDALLKEDTEKVDPASASRLVTPGHRTERVMVLFHGLTNSPRQFEVLTQRFLARGYSIFIPRVPYHGYLDRMTVDLAMLTEADMIDTAASAIDVACGLADQVTVSGISLGGVLAVWAAQYRRIAVAAPIAPAIGFRFLPMPLTGVTFGAMRRLPNRFIWWDPRVKEQLGGPPYAYPRFSTHAIAALQRLALDLMKAARSAPPLAESVWMITNDADLAVNNAANATLVKNWRAAGATNVHHYRFPSHLKLFHDLVDPLQPNSQPDLVHPILEQIIADGTAPSEPSLSSTR